MLVRRGHWRLIFLSLYENSDQVKKIEDESFNSSVLLGHATIVVTRVVVTAPAIIVVLVIAVIVMLVIVITVAVVVIEVFVDYIIEALFYFM
jgi:hypothetical protein